MKLASTFLTALLLAFPGVTAIVDARAIGDSGHIVGRAYDNHFTSRAFLYSDGNMMNLGTLPPPFDSKSEAWGVNGKGEAVGTSYDAHFHGHAVLFRNNQVLDLSALLPQGYSQESEGQGINDLGAMLVGAWNGDLKRSLVISNGVALDVGVLPAPFNVEFSGSRINNRGEVAGSGSDTNQNDDAAVSVSGNLVAFKVRKSSSDF